jgi:hypothetical protein
MRVLLLRPDDIGDCVLFSGYVQRVRATWSAARIDLVVQPHMRNLYELCPHVDRLRSTDRFMPWKWMQRHRMRGAWKAEAIGRRPLFLKLWLPSYDVVIYPVSAPVEDMMTVVRYIRSKDKRGCGGVLFREGHFRLFRYEVRRKSVA